MFCISVRRKEKEGGDKKLCFIPIHFENNSFLNLKCGELISNEHSRIADLSYMQPPIIHSFPFSRE